MGASAGFARPLLEGSGFAVTGGMSGGMAFASDAGSAAVSGGASVLLLAAAASDLVWAKAVLIVLAAGGYLAGAALGLIKLATSWLSRRRSRM